MVRFPLPVFKAAWLLKITAVLSLILVAVSAITVVFADPLVTAPGDLDTSFGINGYVQIPVPGAYTGMHLNSAVLDDQGGILAGGYAEYYDFDPELGGIVIRKPLIQRYNLDGSLDATFGNAGNAILDLSLARATALAVDSSGRIVFVGVFSIPASSEETGQPERIVNTEPAYFLIGRFTADGSVDTTFGGGSGFKYFLTTPTLYGVPHGLDIDTDGKITVAGNHDGMIVLGQVNEDGSLNTDFGDGGVVLESSLISSDATALTHTAEGKLLTAGSAVIEDRRRSILIQYNADGSRDTSFATDDDGNGVGLNSTFYGTAAAFMILPDNKILVASQVDADDSADLSTRIGLARFNSDGRLDTGFGENGMALIDTGYQIGISSIQSDTNGKLLIEGQNNGRGMLLRLTSDGSVDGGFGYQGMILSANPQVFSFNQVLIMPSGKLITIGDRILAQYLSEGASGDEIIVNGSFEAAGAKPKEAGGWLEKGTATKKMRRTCDELNQQRGWIGNCAYLFKPGDVNTLSQSLTSTLTQPDGTLRFSVWLSSNDVNKVAVKAKIRLADDTVTTLKLTVPDSTDPRFIYLQTEMNIIGQSSVTIEKILIKTRNTPSKLIIDAISLKYFPADAGRHLNQLPLPAAPADVASAMLTSR